MEVSSTSTESSVFSDILSEFSCNDFDLEGSEQEDTHTNERITKQSNLGMCKLDIVSMNIIK